MKIGILGGSFDPIHKGHIHIAKTAIQQLNLDEVWFMVANISPFKADGAKTCYENRVRMVEIATANDPKLKVSELEKELISDKSYTIDIARLLQSDGNEYYYLIGDDLIERLHYWKDIDELTKIFNFVCFKRSGNINSENFIKYNVKTIDNDILPYSSSDIRNGNLEGLEKKVLNYCSNNALYLDTMIKAYMSEKRYLHSLSVCDLALEINGYHKLDETKVKIACYLHDIAKEMDSFQQRLLMEKHFKDKINEPEWTYHQFIGRLLAHNDFLIDDEEILDAIEVHATASFPISKLSMLLYIADKTERTREYDSEALIDIAKKDLKKGFVEVFKEVLIYNYKSLENAQDKYKEILINLEKL